MRKNVILGRGLSLATKEDGTLMLPDVLEPGLEVVFCGTAVGPVSARCGLYYAGPLNRFWEMLHRTGLTPNRRLEPLDFYELPSYGIGLTDLEKSRSGMDRDMRLENLVAGVPLLVQKMLHYQPRVLAFNGKNPASIFFRHSVEYGGPIGDIRIGGTVVFVLPSTSAANRRYWSEQPWLGLARFVRGIEEC